MTTLRRGRWIKAGGLFLIASFIAAVAVYDGAVAQKPAGPAGAAGEPKWATTPTTAPRPWDVPLPGIDRRGAYTVEVELYSRKDGPRAADATLSFDAAPAAPTLAATVNGNAFDPNRPVIGTGFTDDRGRFQVRVNAGVFQANGSTDGVRHLGIRAVEDFADGVVGPVLEFDFTLDTTPIVPPAVPDPNDPNAAPGGLRLSRECVAVEQGGRCDGGRDRAGAAGATTETCVRGSHAATLEQMRKALSEWRQATGDRLPASRTPDEFDRETGTPLPTRSFERKPPTGR